MRRVLRIIRDSDISLEVAGLTLVSHGDDGEIVEEDNKPFQLSDAISQTIVMPPSSVAKLESKPNLVRHFEGKGKFQASIWFFVCTYKNPVTPLYKNISLFDACNAINMVLMISFYMSK